MGARASPATVPTDSAVLPCRPHPVEEHDQVAKGSELVRECALAPPVLDDRREGDDRLLEVTRPGTKRAGRDTGDASQVPVPNGVGEHDGSIKGAPGVGVEDYFPLAVASHPSSDGDSAGPPAGRTSASSARSTRPE